MAKRSIPEPDDRLAALEKLRGDLTRSIDEAPAYARAPLARELRATLAEIDVLKPKKVIDRADELAQRRAARRARAASARKTSGGKVRGAQGGGRAR